TINQRNDAVGKFRQCKVVGYIMIVTASNARRCSFAAKVLGRVDDEWMGFVNGYDAYGHPRAVPFDGVVSNERSHYPSPNLLAFDTKVVGPNHQNIYSTTDGLDATTQGMLRLSMDRAPLNSSGIVGPGSMPADYSRSWSINVYGATPPYRYQWSGILSGTQRFVSGSPATSGSLYVDVWDVSGQHLRTSMYVTIVSGCGGRIAC
ncbi:MAG: hypothetical protein M3Z10_05370, partial [Gemmatimonadota bacterium]|nr:hypothetical protein [Gemmatimonadota bacterium]